MQNVPKIVRERLKAAVPAVNHPDADMLTAFAERSLPELERAVVLEHMARCGDCRDIVALALPATESVQEVIIAAPTGWLTWPALRWGFVAAGVIAIASLGILQYQRHSQSSMTAYKASEPEAAGKVAKNESLPTPAAPAPAGRRDKIEAPSAPAFTDAVDTTNAAADEKKSTARSEAAPATAQSSQAEGVIDGKPAHPVRGPLPHGPMLANQWQQNSMAQNNMAQNMAQNRAPTPTPPANKRLPAGSESVEVAGAAPVLPVQDAGLDARQVPSQSAASPSSGENYAYAVGKAKPLPQATPGQIGGYVIDPSGAVVSNARITITPSMTGGTATAVTDSQGAWMIAGLPSGNYKARAEAPGFKTTVLDLNYDANQPSLYSFTLSVGSVSETVEVASAQTQVQMEGATIGGPITNLKVNQAPANGRNFMQMAAVSPALLPRWTINSAGVLQRSFDQGKSWQAVDVNAGPASVGATSLEVVAKASRAKAKDADKALKRDAAPITFRALAATGAEVWAGGSVGALYHSQDAGNHWTRVVPASAGAILTGDILSLNFADIQHGTLSTSNAEVWTTSDDGQTWQKQ
jgi:hypothetical protein